MNGSIQVKENGFELKFLQKSTYFINQAKNLTNALMKAARKATRIRPTVTNT